MIAFSLFRVFHPTTRIMVWVGFIVFIQQSLLLPLLVCSAVLLCLLALSGAWRQLLRLLRRTRWLLLSLALIYGWTTPGAAAFDVALSPSLVGLQAGLLQAWRLALVLAALALLLAENDRSEWLEGLYCLMRPFKALGFSPERAAARLWLTLHYAETASAAGGTLAQRLDAAFDFSPTATEQVVIECRVFTWRDVAVGVLLVVAYAGWLW